MTIPTGGKRNCEFDFWKFVAAIYVVLVHSYNLFQGDFLVAKSGYLAVEFFFIVSGFMFAGSVFRDDRPFSKHTIGAETWKFLWKRINGFLPYYLIGFTVSATLLSIRRNVPLASMAQHPEIIFDIIPLRECGFPIMDLFGVSWYLSSLLMAMLIMYPMFRFAKEMFSDWLAPLFAIMLLGHLYMAYGKIGGMHVQKSLCGLLTVNTLRAISEMCLGVTAYRVSKLIASAETTRLKSSILSALELACMIYACVRMSKPCSGPAQFATIFMFAVAVSVMGSGTAFVNRLFRNKASAFLGKISLPLFLTHCIVRWGILVAARHSLRLQNILEARDRFHVRMVAGTYLTLSLLLALASLLIVESIKRKKHDRT